MVLNKKEERVMDRALYPQVAFVASHTSGIVLRMGNENPANKTAIWAQSLVFKTAGHQF
jgi:hypothetical protein